jgi:hypothetical protein
VAIRFSLKKKPLGNKLPAYILFSIDRVDFLGEFSVAGCCLEWVFGCWRFPAAWEECLGD